MDYSSPCRTVGCGDFCKSISGREANFMEKSELFYKLWEDAVIEQKDCNVIWNCALEDRVTAHFGVTTRAVNLTLRKNEVS